MADKSKMPKRSGTISEEDAFAILQRYSATTVLTLLQEVAQVQDVKIDWNALVKHTKTGITNPKEYQMLWRHIAYRDPLHENVEDEAEPLDDDSDLEYELEAFPPVSNEASAEAAACVKVLIASGAPSDSGLEKGLTVEAPLTINIPKSKSTGPSSEAPHLGDSIRAANITVPVSVPKQPLPTATSAEGLDTNGCANSNLPARRKRKPWSEAEDMELFAAVQKCGEGNWANILKGDFKGDRTASQLSQRWNIIKKRKNNPNMKSGSQLSEVHLAARRALNMALDKPGVDNPKAASSVATGRPTPSVSVQPVVTDAPSAGGKLPPNQTQQESSPTAAKRPIPKTQPLPKKPSPKPPTTGPDAVKAAAVAAGARIATQSAAAAILKAQLKSAIHIKTTTAAATRPSPGAPMGSDYLRDLYSSLSRASPGSGFTNPHVGQVGPSGPTNTTPETNVSSETAATSGSPGSPKAHAQEDQVAVSGGAQKVETALDVTAPPNGNGVKAEASGDNALKEETAAEDELKRKMESVVKLSSEETVLPLKHGGDGNQLAAMAIVEEES